MKNIAKLFIFIPIIFTLVIPVISFAQKGSVHPTYELARQAAQDVPDSECYPGGTKPEPGKGLVQCGRKLKCEYEVKVDKNNNLEPADDKYIVGDQVLKTIDSDPVTGDLCDFNDVMELVNNIINFILFALALPIAAIMFVYAGFTLITAGADNSSARTKAKSIFFSAVIGLVLAFVAYLIVMFVLKALGYSGDWIFRDW